MEEVMAVHDRPLHSFPCLITDDRANGSNNARHLGIDKLRTTSYQPAGNGTWDRLKQTIIRELRRVVHGVHLEQWHVALNPKMVSIKKAVQSSLGLSS